MKNVLGALSSPDNMDKQMICEICTVDCENESNYFQHISTAKHKKNYKMLEDQGKVNVKCGLYIKGTLTTFKSCFIVPL